MVSLLLILLFGMTISWAQGGEGHTPLVPGARNLPSGFILSAPFPEGTEFRVSCGYSPCNAYHSGVENEKGVNDHYALDLTVNQRGNGEGHFVSAAAPAEVVFSGWGQGHWGIYGQMVILHHGVYQGKPLISFYAHLGDLLVKKGDQVTRKQNIGRLGRSSGGKLEKLAAHLHFSVQWGPSTDGGPLGGRAVLPEPMDGYVGFKVRQVHVAGSGEKAALYVTVDELSPQFEAFVPETSMRVEEDTPTEYEQYIYGTKETWSSANGYGPKSRRLIYTQGQGGVRRVIARWSPVLRLATEYGVQIYLPPEQIASVAEYIISDGSQTVTCERPVSPGGGWTDLCDGRYFSGAPQRPLVVTLKSREGTVSGSQISIDAVRFVGR